MNFNCPICESTNTKIIFKNYPGYVQGKDYDILKCGTCGTHYIQTDQDETNKIYDAIYQNENIIGYDRYLQFANAVKISNTPLKELAELESTYFPFFEIFTDKQKCRILEIGCGYGYLTFALNKSGHDAFGIDLSEDAVVFAKNNFGEFYKHISFEEFSDSSIEKKYDYIIATELIEHLIKPGKLPAYATKLLKKDGALIITTPNRDYYPADHVWLTDLPPVHTSWFGKNSLKFLAAKFNMHAEFFNFKDYLPNYENRLIRFIRSRKEHIQTPLLKSDFTINEERFVEHGKFHKFLNYLLHDCSPIRVGSNLIYNLLNGEERVLTAILTKK